MDLLPEWAPNAHPLIVHFPIALFFTALVFDALALTLHERVRWARPGAVALYLAAGISALVAFLTGRNAADSVLLPAEAQSVLSEHADLGEWTAWGLGLYALVRLGLVWWEGSGRRAVQAVLFVVALGGGYLVWQTAEHGAMLVFRYGAGVQAVDTDGAEPQGETAARGDASATAEGPVVAENGAWRWTPNAGDAAALGDTTFRWLAGSPGALQAEITEAGDRGEVLALAPTGGPALFTTGPDIRGVQADALVDLSGFDGSFMLVHHVQGAQTFDFLEVEGGTMRQGRMVDGQRKIFDEKPFEMQPWLRLRVVGDKTHFRGYAGDELVTHGHDDELDPGPVGLRLEGTGRVLLDRLDVQVTR